MSPKENKDAKFFKLSEEQRHKIYHKQNELCREILREVRREWLAAPGAFGDAPGSKLRALKDRDFVRIHAIYYSDDVQPTKAAEELLKAMRTWVVAHAHSDEGVAFILHGKGNETELMVSVPAYGGSAAVEAAFPGVVFEKTELPEKELKAMKSGGAITGIPAFTDDETSPLYSLDTFLRGMRGKSYALIIAANPLPSSQLIRLKEEAQRRIGENSRHIKQSVAEITGESEASTLGVSAGGMGSVSSSLSLGITAVLGGVPFLSVIPSITKTVSESLGGMAGVNASYTKTKNRSVSNTAERLNRYAEAYEEWLREYEERIQDAESMGGWTSAVYLLAADSPTYQHGASLFRSGLTAEYDTHEPFRSNRIKLKGNETWLDCIRHTRRCGRPERELSTVLTSPELAALMCLPMESHPGIEIRPTPRFSVTSPTYRTSEPSLTLGHICDREVALSNEFCIHPRDLTAHTLVAGLTGMGKSTTIRHILAGLEVPFLVLEPAKCEYRHMIVDGKHIRVFTAGDEQVTPLRINPFEIPQGDSLHSHMDALTAILNAAFPMEGPMAALVEQGIVKAYEEAGWDTTLGVPPQDGGLPTMDSFYSALEKHIDSQKLSGDYGNNIRNALLTRINSLRVGSRGKMFNTIYTFDVAELLRAPCVIEMRKVGSDEAKAFLCGLLLLRLYKHMEHMGASHELRNVLVVEEAHRIFRKVTQNASSIVGNNTAHQSVMMFENILAEVRAFGLGVIIADQLPLRLSDGAVKNTNLKIIHRLSALEDAQAMGGGMGLSLERSMHICRLKVGEALVHSSTIPEAAHVKLLPFEANSTERTDKNIRSQAPTPLATDHRPPYFDQTLAKMREMGKEEYLAVLADSFWFTLLMLPQKSDFPSRLGHLWTAMCHEMNNHLAQIINRKNLNDSLTAHLAHYAVWQLLRNKAYIKLYDSHIYRHLIKLWDSATNADMSLNISVVKDCVQKCKVESINGQDVLPVWVPENLKGEVHILYNEARQMAASVWVQQKYELSKAIAQNHLDELASSIFNAISQRIMPSMNICTGNDHVSTFAMAVAVAIIEASGHSVCKNRNAILKLVNIFGKYYKTND